MSLNHLQKILRSRICTQDNYWLFWLHDSPLPSCRLHQSSVSLHVAVTVLVQYYGSGTDGSSLVASSSNDGWLQVEVVAAAEVSERATPCTYPVETLKNSRLQYQWCQWIVVVMMVAVCVSIWTSSTVARQLFRFAVHYIR